MKEQQSRSSEVERRKEQQSRSSEEERRKEPTDKQIVNKIVEGIQNKKGHRIVVQVQSSWYPLMAVSPQFFQENPYTVPAADYRTCRVTVWNDSWISLPVAAVGE